MQLNPEIIHTDSIRWPSISNTGSTDIVASLQRYTLQTTGSEDCPLCNQTGQFIYPASQFSFQSFHLGNQTPSRKNMWVYYYIKSSRHVYFTISKVVLFKTFNCALFLNREIKVSRKVQVIRYFVYFVWKMFADSREFDSFHVYFQQWSDVPSQQWSATQLLYLQHENQWRNHFCRRASQRSQAVLLSSMIHPASHSSAFSAWSTTE